MQKEIFARGPISCCMSLPDDFLYGYTGGVYVTNASATGLERCQHSVTTVGWGYDAGSGLGYWRVLNSMGTVWGEKGFFRIARSAHDCSATQCLPRSLTLTRMPPPRSSSLKPGQHNLAIERFCAWVMPAF